MFPSGSGFVPQPQVMATKSLGNNANVVTHQKISVGPPTFVVATSSVNSGFACGFPTGTGPTNYMSHNNNNAKVPTTPVGNQMQSSNSWNSNPPGANNKTWQFHPQQNVSQGHPQQIQQNDTKHQDYLKQQQRLKSMALSSSKNLTADALIGNLLEKKDIFRPKPVAQNQNLQVNQCISSTSSSHPSQLPQFQSGAAMQVPIGVNMECTTSQVTNNIPSSTNLGQISDGLPAWLTPGSPRLPPIYNHIWCLVADPSSGGAFVDTNKILALLLTSGLPKEVLGYIWNLATNGSNGKLTEKQLYITLALVALAQSGCTFNNLNTLNLIPQVPVPSFNMTVPKPCVEEKSQKLDVNLCPPRPTLTSSSELTLGSRESDDFADDFTDFQSAEVNDGFSVPSVSSCFPSTTVVQPAVTAKQVLSEINHSVVSKLGRSQGRSIGSRLANHTLGAPKVRNHHHKHRRPSIERDISFTDDDVSFGSDKPCDNSNATLSWRAEDSSSGAQLEQLEQENEDFSDFQIASGLNVNVDELFPRCNVKQKRKSITLKESAIRNDSLSSEEATTKNSEVELLSLDSPTESTLTQSDPKMRPTTAAPSIFTPALKPPKELLVVEEDKYSALRFLELENSPNKDRTDIDQPVDDFGDFVSADDSFAEIASRSTTAAPVVNINWNIATVQSPKFVVSDWEQKNVFQPNSISEKSVDLLSASNTSTFSSNLDSAFMELNISSSATPIQSQSKDDARSWTLDLITGKESPEASLQHNPVNNVDDEEFGEFIGPSTQENNTNGESPPKLLCDSQWIEESGAKSTSTFQSDNRSVNSLEFSNMNLSRHGSLPSLDLKLFSGNDESSDKIGDNIQVSDWARCADSSLLLLQTAVNTFSSISSQQVILEVLGTDEGRNYFNNLLEVNRICLRIERSYQQSDCQSYRLESLLGTIQKTWDALLPFYGLANIETASEKDRSNQESGQPACGVCGVPASRNILEYGGRSYHAPCANLWLNCVDRTLPFHSLLL